MKHLVVFLFFVILQNNTYYSQCLNKYSLERDFEDVTIVYKGETLRRAYSVCIKPSTKNIGKNMLSIESFDRTPVHIHDGDITLIKYHIWNKGFEVETIDGIFSFRVQSSEIIDEIRRRFPGKVVEIKF